MHTREGPLAMVERHVREAEERVLRQRANVKALHTYGSLEALELEKLTLETLEAVTHWWRDLRRAGAAGW